MTYERLIFIFLLSLFFGMNAKAQIFIPFGFWANQSSPLAISPTLLYIQPGDVYTFSASGGSGTYSWSITAGATTDGATITSNNATADYTARLTSYTTDVVTLTGGGTASATVVTYDALTISPATVTLMVNGTQTFTGAGGCLNGTNCVGGARVFSVVSGNGAINSSSGFYTAAASSGTTVVQVADSIGNIAQSTITVVNDLTITPSSLKLAVYSTNTFSAIAGSSPYTFSITSGTGTINSSSGLYTAASATGTAVVRVTDSLTFTSDASVTIIKPVDVKVGQYFACALHNEGSVKCWGTNGNGQLGVGSTSTIGDVTTEVGGANIFVDLGTGRTATQIAVGLAHACALLDNATIKCWGASTYGQLGQGNTNSIGDNANEMGNNLASISLGTGRTATAVYAFGYVSCAILDDATSKCWGRNSNGQLGLENTNNRGDNASEMGDNLTAINLGTSRTASKITGGFDFTCALLDNATVKCWGNNQKGQLGQDSATAIGKTAGTMGDSLTAINLGSGRTATDLQSGYQFSCVKRDDNTEICWGRNSDGQCGTGASNGLSQDIGDGSGETVGTLSAINMSTGFGTLSQIFTFGSSSCAMDTLNVVKCWGRNNEGELLYGNATSRDAPIATVVNFGTSLVVSKMSGSYYTLCALFTNDRIKCWGRATNASGVASGVFLNTGTASLGDGAGETGDGLPYVDH